jgi:hypothetical protein
MWVELVQVRFFFFFGRNALRIAIFVISIVLSPYPLLETYGGWVRREG